MLWLIVGTVLTLWVGWEYGEELAALMLYVGLASWIAFISVIIASQIIKTEPIEIQQQYDSDGKKSFVDNTKTGVFKNSNMSVGRAKKKSLTILGMAISTEHETWKKLTFGMKVILACSLLVMIPFAFMFYNDVVRKHVGDIVEVVFAIFLLGSLMLIGELRGIRDNLRCPNKNMDDRKPINRILYFPTFAITGMAISILSFYLLGLSPANLIIAIIWSIVIQVAVTFTYLNIIISKCSPCIHCMGKWVHDGSCRYHVGSNK
ncbi:MAG: hypothetical protein GKS07_10415 [Nitrosopumilus sp.]|nr:MAG: hypothetical protein GKS07_10415 [Nitrosopumilus sp.]